MTAGPALPCPKCHRPLEALSWHGADHGNCRFCRAEFEFTAFPALTAARRHVTPKAVLIAEHATCFYHAQNQAETVCESCGRFLCSVCAVEFGGRRVCPPCIATVKDKDAHAVSQRTLYDGLALGIAVLPILFWPVTLLTAPAALGVVIYGWRKPRSLVGGGRVRMVIAGLFAVAQIVTWTFVFVSIWTKE